MHLDRLCGSIGSPMDTNWKSKTMGHPDAFKNNLLALADPGKYFGLPTILTTSFEKGPNGPLAPELVVIPTLRITTALAKDTWDDEDSWPQ
jgi:hypothetical protein